MGLSPESYVRSPNRDSTWNQIVAAGRSSGNGTSSFPVGWRNDDTKKKEGHTSLSAGSRWSAGTRRCASIPHTRCPVAALISESSRLPVLVDKFKNRTWNVEDTQTLRSSFSTVSRRISATKCSFYCCISKACSDIYTHVNVLHTFAPVEAQNVRTMKLKMLRHLERPDINYHLCCRMETYISAAVSKLLFFPNYGKR